MPVGKGSIARAVKSQNKEVEKATATEEKVMKQENAVVKEPEPKQAAKKVTEKKSEKKTTAVKKTAVKKPAVKKEINIHEEKYQVISHIQCELPVHLL